MRTNTIIANNSSPILKQKAIRRAAKRDPAAPKGRGGRSASGARSSATPHHSFGNTPTRKEYRTGWEGIPSGEFRKGAALRTCLSKEVFPPIPPAITLCGDFAKQYDAPWYNQKLWDDDADNDGDSDGFMGAPTTRTLSDIAMTVAVSFVAPGAGNLLMGAVLGTAMNMADDAVFTMMDVANGMDATDAWGSLGKKAATSFVSQYAGGAIGGLDDTFKMTDSSVGSQIMEVGSDIGIAGTTTAVNTYSSAAINSIGSNGFSWNTFNDMTSWDNTGASYMSSLAGTATQGAFESVFNDSAINSLSNSGWGSMAGKVQNVGVLAGNAARGITEYGMTGNTTLNILNTSMFNAMDRNGKALNQGLLELNVGKNGVHGNLGTSGIRADYDAIADAVEGLYVLGSEHSIRKNQSSYADNINSLSGTSYETEGLARMNRMMRAYGGLNAKLQAGSMMRSNTDLVFRDGGDGKAETDIVDGKRRVSVNNQNAMNSTNDMLRTVVTLNHEAYRDGVDSTNQIGETRRAVAGHVDSMDRIVADYGDIFLDVNQDLKTDYMNYKEYGNDYVDAAYDSSADYWKLMDDGSIVWDKKKDLTNERGEVIRKDKTGSYSLSLLTWMEKDNAVSFLTEKGIDTSNMNDSEIASQLMSVSGAEWDRTAYSETTGKNTGAYVPTSLPGGQSANMSGLEDRLRFQLSNEYAFNLGKISQESSDIAYWVKDSEGKKTNAMAETGCYYMSTLGGVQTQAGKLLNSEQINRITRTSLEKGWLAKDSNSIFPTGSESRTEISQLAFAELGQFGYLDFGDNLNSIDGSIIVGKTVNDNNHAREGNSFMNREIYDPYEGISYLPNQNVIQDESNYYEYIDYQKYYWQQYEELFY